MQPTQNPQTPPEPPAEQPSQVNQTAPSANSHRSRAKWIVGSVAALLVLVIVATVFWKLGQHSSNAHVASITKKPVAAAQSTAQTVPSPTQSNVDGLQLDSKKNYGNKYADGKLPVGDGKYSTTAAKKGYVYACSQYAQNLATDTGGAQVRGPWFTNNNTEYDLNKKVHVSGSVNWQSVHSFTLSASNLIVTSNDLPNHSTGTFPIASSDPAHAVDANPNSIKSQSLSYTLPANPVYGAPQCMGGQAGIMTTGVALFNGFDAGGRDAGAWEVQDSCSGHPQSSGEYHYHTLSSCISDIGVTTVIGYALDGFPITGPKVGTDNMLTTDDLDECHGLVSTIKMNGKPTTTYHYVMTQDFPYSVSCFRATPIQTNPEGGQSNNQKLGMPPPRPGTTR